MAQRAQRLNPSTIREILKLTERPGIISLAGGLPAAETFPVEAMAQATARVLRDAPREALQYAASEGYGPLREWVAQELAGQGLRVQAAQVLITTGSQQGLDLVGKVLIDPGSEVAVEQPTYLGALQAFAPYEAQFLPLEGDDEGPLPQALRAAGRARFAYLLPNFQNPSGRCIPLQRRLALAEAAASAGLPLVEDNPYGDLWYDEAPPQPLAAAAGDQAVYLGSFSKVLAPGLRLGYVVAPAVLYPKLLQAKQAADLHTETYPESARNRFTVYRPDDGRDAIFLHPGEPVFERLSAMAIESARNQALRGAIFTDVSATAPYLFHVARVSVERGVDPGLPAFHSPEAIEQRLVGLKQYADGRLIETPVEHLLLLKSAAKPSPGSVVWSTRAACSRCARWWRPRWRRWPCCCRSPCRSASSRRWSRASRGSPRHGAAGRPPCWG